MKQKKSTYIARGKLLANFDDQRSHPVSGRDFYDSPTLVTDSLHSEVSSYASFSIGFLILAH